VEGGNSRPVAGIYTKEGALRVARPFWSGQVKISLVSFGVKLFPATEAKSEIHFHQISRKSGERIRHQKVSESDEAPVEKDDIVKGYEYSKGKYVQIDPEEVEHLRIPSRHTVELQLFVDLEELDPALFEKPYFVLPDKDSQSEAFAVVRKALQESKKAGLGKIAMGGREHLIAIAACADPRLPGLMAYTLRYAEELRSAKEYFSDIKAAATNAESLSLAKELIHRKTGKFDPSKFTDDYETALRELVKPS
jgi:DNA end-binding protein Ku